MEKSTLRYALLNGLGFLCMLGAASASPPGADPELLSLVPPGTAIVAQVTYGTEPTYLVLTRNNTADLMDLQSISGVDPTRTIKRTIFVVVRDGQGVISEHSLLASGHFDTRHIFKAAQENGATESEYVGIPVLIVPPLDRDKGISDDVRWFAVIDSEIAVFGTIPMVREELSRYMARSPADTSLMRKLSHLRSTDQSWCVLAPTIYNREIVRRTLAALDPGLGQPHANDGLILGIHFGRHVEIEYESIPDSDNSDGNQPQAQPIFSPAPNQITPHLASSFVSNSGTTLAKVIRLSKKQYEEFIAQQQAREQAYGTRRSN